MYTSIPVGSVALSAGVVVPQLYSCLWTMKPAGLVVDAHGVTTPVEARLTSPPERHDAAVVNGPQIMCPSSGLVRLEPFSTIQLGFGTLAAAIFTTGVLISVARSRTGTSARKSLEALREHPVRVTVLPLSRA